MVNLEAVDALAVAVGENVRLNDHFTVVGLAVCTPCEWRRSVAVITEIVPFRWKDGVLVDGQDEPYKAVATVDVR